MKKTNKIYDIFKNDHKYLNSDWNIKFMPDTELLKSGRETIVYFVETQTGAWTSVTMKNNITRLKRNVISSATVKG